MKRPEILKYIDILEQRIKDLQTKLNTYEIEDSITQTVKHVQPDVKPVRTIHFEGQDIPEDEVVYFIDKDTFEILSDIMIRLGDNFDDSDLHSKIYLTKSEVNARLKEMVTERAKERTFSFKELEFFNENRMDAITPLDYAIELIEKELNIKYL